MMLRPFVVEPLEFCGLDCVDASCPGHLFPCGRGFLPRKGAFTATRAERPRTISGPCEDRRTVIEYCRQG